METALLKNDQVVGRLINGVDRVFYSARQDETLCFDFISEYAIRLTGYSHEDLDANNDGWLGIIVSEDLDRYFQAFEKCTTSKESVSVEYRINCADGTEKQLCDTVWPVCDDQGDVIAFDGVITEVTHQAKVIKELERTQLLQNLGRLSAGIAHEINTPVQFISDNIHFISDSFEQILELVKLYKQALAAEGDEASVKKCLGQIDEFRDEADLDFVESEIPQAVAQCLEGIGHVITIVGAMRDFSHIDERRMYTADINKAVQSTVVIAKNELKYVADIVLELDENMPMVMCSVDQLCQVFLNLLINAAHSIADVIEASPGQKGTITVTSKTLEDTVEIAVSDTGTGITDEVKAEMFEPFFTTKAPSKGTGQGLAFIKTIVEERHNGSIVCDTQPGQGTTFTLSIPIEGTQRKK